jgi:phosphatidylglycerophosphate synthase
MQLLTMLLQAVKVNSLGKWKTALQMVSMSTLLVLRQDHAALTAWLPALLTRESLLWNLGVEGCMGICCDRIRHSIVTGQEHSHRL